jgi:hypothetical protein
MSKSGTTSSFILDVPVALICFNRPAQTARAMEALRKARPPKLYVIADAARQNIATDQARCAEVRAIVTQIDWPCDLVTDFASINMGCRDRIISGLNRAFQENERLIVIEDDCVPHPDFFRFAQEMLEHYAENSRVFAISGDNFQPHTPSTRTSYYFSRIFHCWGWASWRDRWQAIDFSMSQWPRLRDSDWLIKTLGTPVAAEHYRQAFDETFQKKNNSWAYRASFASLVGDLVNILPSVNMVTNIGVDEDATHTRDNTGFEGRAAYGLDFPLTHPISMEVNEAADRDTFNRMGGAWRRRVKMNFRHALHTLLRKQDR